MLVRGVDLYFVFMKHKCDALFSPAILSVSIVIILIFLYVLYEIVNHSTRAQSGDKGCLCNRTTATKKTRLDLQKNIETGAGLCLA
uniref:Uncharacterized protein n=1 Tax=Arundo donax TaxID=35708 RepID=A0A0A9LWG4_ARUDO